MDWLSIAVLVLVYLAYPILVLLRALWTILLFIVAPFVHVGYYVMYACWWPLHLLAKLETLYIFFGAATLVGIITGTSLHYISTFLASILNIDVRSEELQARRMDGDRARKLENLEAQEPMPKLFRLTSDQPKIGMKDEYAEWLKQDISQQRKKGLIPTTILEEDDSSEDAF